MQARRLSVVSATACARRRLIRNVRPTSQRPVTTENANRVIRVLTTDDVVFGLEIDSLLRQGGNEMTAMALLRALDRFDFASDGFPSLLAEFVSSHSLGDPSSLIGFDDGRWQDLPEGDDSEAEEESDSVSVHFLRLIHSSEDASYYLFHASGRVLDGSYVRGSARKREGAIHHLKVELSHPRFLQQVVARARECPHLLRVEESSEEEFWAAPSHSI